MPQRIRSTCVLGLGQSGIAAARQALADGDDVVIYAGRESEATRSAAREFADAGIRVVFDDECPHGPFDLCVVCPGIPATGAFYRNALAASAELIGEPEYAWRHSPHGWLAVTGTNGKTTTATLLAHILRSCGMPALLCGNTQATTATQTVATRRPEQPIVAELSSFQLASTRAFSPRVGCLLNITSDHIAWHGSRAAYAEAKLALFSHMEPGSCAVVTDEVEREFAVADSLRARGVRVVTVGQRRAADCAYADADGTLVLVDACGDAQALCSADALQIRGAHNVCNALVAASAAADYGCEPAAIAAALAAFAPLAHRMQPVGSVAGVTFYDDSKATNVDATLKALTAFAEVPVVLMLGGRDKGTDLSALVEAARRCCRAVVAYGEGGQRFHDAFAGSGLECALEAGMADAFARACALAQPGDAVLLSPACASFDEFSGFDERGRVFGELVAARRAETCA